MKKLVCGAFAAALLSTVAAPAFAADLPSTKSAPVFAPIDNSFDPFMIRVSALGVLPNADGTTLGGKTMFGAKLDDVVVPEVDLTYFVTKNWAVNVIAGVAHTRLTSNYGGAYSDWANTTLLPPTLTLQYHFALGKLDPYLGVGANYTWFLETKSPWGAANPYGANAINLHPAAGLALNAGADYYLTKHWTLNLDAKYLILNTDGNTPLGVNTVHVNANTWLIGAGIGYRFGGSEAAPVVAKY